MALRVMSDEPSALLTAIRTGIRKREIRTWSYDDDGDFTHSAAQWSETAWLQPSVGAGELTLNIIPPRGGTVTADVYAVYHGRFIEMLLTHFDSEFSTAHATACPAAGDQIQG